MNESAVMHGQPEVDAVIRFGEFALDPGQRRLFRSSIEVHLSPKGLQLLSYLIDRAPRAVSKQELYDALWPDVFVSETNLAGIAAELRSALEDDARDPQFVRTVHGFGYAFFAPLRGQRPAVEHARFRIDVRGHETRLGTGAHEIGRSPGADILVDDPSVSREHARLICRDDGATVEDLRSKNGTFVNGQRTTGVVPLHDGDVVLLGTVTLVFRDLRVAEPTVTVDVETAAAANRE